MLCFGRGATEFRLAHAVQSSPGAVCDGLSRSRWMPVSTHEVVKLLEGIPPIIVPPCNTGTQPRSRTAYTYHAVTPSHSYTATESGSYTATNTAHIVREGT